MPLDNAKTRGAIPLDENLSLRSVTSLRYKNDKVSVASIALRCTSYFGVARIRCRAKTFTVIVLKRLARLRHHRAFQI
jgi:hypothetical protein